MMKKTLYTKILLASCSTLLVLHQLGCAKKKQSQSSASKTPEESYCAATSQAGTTISGTAQFEQMLPQISGGLSTPVAKPIRKAEVVVLNSAGTILQCGETDDNGNYSLSITPQTGTITVKVNSRGNNAYIKASILDDVNTNKYYSVSGSVAVNASDSTVTGPSLLALATGSLEAGAFNIYEQILKTNEYLINNSTDSSCSVCSQFQVLNKANIYWKKGYTPGSLVGNPNLNVSFFDSGASLSSTPSLYILGGSSGDVDYSDTDHFDNQVIIHEYGHFLEYYYGKSDSPGGSHNGNLKIDPRLAWSEGFADFLPSAVTGIKYYLDTEGSPYGSTATSISISLETVGNYDAIDNSTLDNGEGVYREISIARALNDYIDSTSDAVINPLSTPTPTVSESSAINFAYIWAALTHTDLGLKNSSLNFRSMGHFNEKLRSILVSSYGSSSSQIQNFDVARRAEYQVADTSQYAQVRTLTSSSCNRTMSPTIYQNYQILVCNHSICNNSNGTTSDDYDIESVFLPDIFESSDYFSYTHNGGALNLKLEYSTDTNNPSDLGLVLYRQDHVLDDQSTWAGFSKNARANESPIDTEQISIANLSAGVYLIEVRATTSSTHAGGLATYNLKIGDQFLCP